MQNTTIVVYRLTYLCYLLIEKIAVPLQTKKKLWLLTQKKITTMKKFIVGDGRADKSQVAYALTHKHGFDGKDILIPIYYKTKPNTIKDMIYDVSDATALAYYVSLNNNE